MEWFPDVFNWTRQGRKGIDGMLSFVWEIRENMKSTCISLWLQIKKPEDQAENNGIGILKK